MRDFVHLHLHTQYSLLDGAIRMKKLMPRVEAAGMKAVAMTDHGNMFGAVDFFKKAKKAGIKPIIGSELYIAAEGHTDRSSRKRHHIVLIAKNHQGYMNLVRLSSISWLDGMHVVPRIDLDLIAQYKEGLIGLSGCLGNQIAQAVLKGEDDQAIELATRYRDAFEPGMFHLEVQHTGLPDQDKVNAAYRQIGKQLDIPLCATNNVHYLDKSEARAHEVLIAIQMGRPVSEVGRIRQSTDELWLKPPEVMWDQLGADYPDALERTVELADMIDVELDLGNVYLPAYPVPDGHDTDSWLVHCSQTGLEERYAEFAAVGKEVDKAAYQDRLDIELKIIIQMGFPGYFLIVQDFINWAKDHDIPVGPGRGSGAGSLVAYALRITDIDPIPYGLLFERFLNPERVSMPDFDIDFCMNRRGEVIQYVTEKYGHNNVGQIATYGSLKARGVIKDVGRALGMSYGETDRLSKMVPDVLGITLQEAIDQEPRLKALYDEDQNIKDLMDIALSLEGLHRQAGMHAAGIVIGDKPLWDYCPVFRGANDEIVTQFAKDEVEEAGLVKFDFLGLKTLTVIDDALRMVNRDRPDDPLDLNAVGLSDPGVYVLMGKGETDGVFQLESSGFMELLKKLKPDKFEDIVAAVALYRPGPIQTGMLDDFIERKHGRQEITYAHPVLESILNETNGVIVYQEQVMQIAREMAGFSLGGADLLRRAMGKKKLDVMAAQRVVFINGAKEKDIPEEISAGIFDLMAGFAAYGFNKSHSAAYALLTYHTAYLKVHHRPQFMAALLTNDKESTDKVTREIRSARDAGIEVLPPCVNESQDDFDVVEGKIRFGLGGVKGVGGTAVDAIIKARNADGPFVSYRDFCERVDLKRVNKKTLEALIKAGALDCFNAPRARLIAAMEVRIERAHQAQRDKASGQGDMFSMLSSPTGGSVDELPADILAVEEWSEKVLLANEKSSLGFYVSGHPLDRFADEIGRYGVARVEQLKRMDNFSQISLAGVVTALRVRPFKSGNGRMGILTFEDQTGVVEAICMGDDLDRFEHLLSSDEPLLVQGRLRVEHEDGRVEVSLRIGNKPRRGQPVDSDAPPAVMTLLEVRALKARGLEIAIPTASVDRARLEKLRALLLKEEHHGRVPPSLRLITEDQCDVHIELPGFKVSPTDDLQHAVKRLLDGNAEIRIL
ncbi:MAG: DNA polymerase III subunit alpha [Bradymonadia bacterium]